MKRLFPQFNQQEQIVVSAIDKDQLPAAADLLRRLTQAASGER